MSLVIDKEYDPVAWGSHLPALLACVVSSEGPVLESGVGHFSTPALHAVCGSLERILISVEKEDQWRDKFANVFQSPLHVFLPSFNSVDMAIKWGTVFIDDSPGGENRAEQFKRFIGLSRFVVVHDYHKDNEESIASLLVRINVHICRMYEPPTLVAGIGTLPDIVFSL